MEELQVNIYAFLGVVELSLILLVLALVFVVRSRRLAHRIRVLEVKLRKAQQMPEPVSFEQYLRDEVLRNQDLMERAAASQDDAEKKAGELLEMRKRFLELEVEARALEKNPVEFQDRLSAGLSELIEQLRPEPETITETETITEPPETVEEPASDEEGEAQRETHDTHDEEIDHLKQVINNQQDAMAALRAKLKEHEHELVDVAEILARLDEYERQSGELRVCLETLEQENQRLKAEAEDTDEAARDHTAVAEPAQLNGLKSMVGKQQATIGKLQDLIRELAPDASKAKELEDAMEAMRRANQELNGCVSVLEDENAKLRAELEQIQMQMESQEQPGEEDTEPGIEAVGEHGAVDADEERQQLEIKVQELEALVEFKDAAIEELEKQYNALQAKYLAVSGESELE